MNHQQTQSTTRLWQRFICIIFGALPFTLLSVIALFAIAIGAEEPDNSPQALVSIIWGLATMAGILGMWLMIFDTWINRTSRWWLVGTALLGIGTLIIFYIFLDEIRLVPRANSSLVSTIIFYSLFIGPIVVSVFQIIRYILSKTPRHEA